MNLKKLVEIFSDKNCVKIYIKSLAPNDNSKNQIYFGGSFDILNILPIKEITTVDEGDWKRKRFKTKVDFSWVSDDGDITSAPDAQLILYPKYPEVRFSGFLKGAKNAPSGLMASRIPNRLLFLGVTDDAKVLGYVASPDSSLAREVADTKNLEEAGVFQVLTIAGNKIEGNSRQKLLAELKRINNLGWINSKRLNKNKEVLPCNSSNCGGYTLEAELGITPNGYSEPDFLGWEVKQYGVSNFRRISSSTITLMTPEPTHGIYVDQGVEHFVRCYGYEDKNGREARINFGGIYKPDIIHPTTSLKMVITGYDSKQMKITDVNGFIGLIDRADNIAASWSFASLIKHWNTKHANACYVPSMNRKMTGEIYKQQYIYHDQVMLGSQTDFLLFLRQFALGNIYYDPAIKLELAIEGQRKQNIKRRSQFRIRSSNLIELYKQNEIIDLKTV